MPKDVTTKTPDNIQPSTSTQFTNDEQLNNNTNTNTKSRKSLKIGLMLKVTTIVVALLVTVSSISIYTIYSLSYEAIKNQLENRLMLTASSATSILDIEQFKLLNTEEDENTETYLNIQKKLQNFKDLSMGNIKYMYTLKKAGNKVIYAIDATPISDSENHSTCGSDFSISDYPEVNTAFTKPTAEKNIVLDKQFNVWTQSGYAPIKDEKGNVVGVLGIDMDVTQVQNEASKLILAGKISLGSTIFLAILLGIFFSKYFTAPIINLTSVTRRVTEGDFDANVLITRNDEFGELAQSFNTMTKQLKKSRIALESYNKELEGKVELRTFELSHINREIKDILDNMSQAIFTIDKNLNFNDQHSKFAYEIFGITNFSGINICDLLFNSLESKNHSEKESFENWLRMIFDSNLKNWNNLEALQPIRELKIIKKIDKNAEVTKFINLEFHPITDILSSKLVEETTKIMVIIQDITEKKNLEVIVQNIEKDYKDNIHQIIEIIKSDPELFEEYINESKENLLNFEPKLIYLKECKDNTVLINDLFRIMHTLKGNARTFKLERIANQAHIVEEVFSEIRKGNLQMTDALLDDTFHHLDIIKGMFNETLEIFETISVTKSELYDNKNYSNEPLEENDTIKIKIGELHRLQELIKRADRLVSDNHTPILDKQNDNQKVETIEHLLKETQQHLNTMSRVTLERLFVRLPRIVRELSIELGKKVGLTVQGETIEIDKKIFDAISDPLLHIVRNSLDHGIETPEERAIAGKLEIGKLEILANCTDSELTINIIDDGNGIDIDKTKANAVKKGITTASNALKMTDFEASNLIFHPGLSTCDSVSEISGRGVGMDVVKTAIEDHLNGKISIDSQKGIGMKITITIPI